MLLIESAGVTLQIRSIAAFVIASHICYLLEIAFL